MKVKVLADGTRVYANYTRYTPVPLEKRKYGVRKPDDPDAVMYNKEWFLPLRVLLDSIRSMPETRPDDDAYEHTAKPRKCMCVPCQRPTAAKWQAKWRADQMRSTSS